MSPRVNRTRAFAFTALLVISANPALAAPGDRKELLLTGFALDRDGRPLSGARIQVSGDMASMTMSGSDGRFLLSLPVGTVAGVTRRPVRVAIDARSRGKSLRLAEGPDQLQLTLRGAGDHMVCESNVPRIAAAVTAILAEPGEGIVPFEATFTAAVAGLDASAPAMVLAPAQRAADSLAAARRAEMWGHDRRGGAERAATPTAASTPAGTAPAGTAPAASAPAARAQAASGGDAGSRGIAVVKTLDDAAPAPPSSAPPASAPGAAAAAPPTTGAPAPPRPAGPLDASRSRTEVLRDTTARAGAVRRPGREAPSAAEMLASARQFGTILSDEGLRDSLRAAERERRAAQRPIERDDRGSRLRDGRRPDGAPVAGLASQQERKSARRDSLREADERRAREREARRYEEAYRAAVRRDSAIAAMRFRDSLATLQRALSQLEAQDRQDSLRAARTRPRLDARVPVAGRVPPARETSGDRGEASESCYCNVEGTIEVRTNRPLSSPFGVTVAVRGRPSLRDRVLLFMGAPREFVIGRVPCGTRYLDVLPEPGRRFVVERSAMLGPFDCESGTLRQLRIVLVPR